jgi:hypothetical protein
MTSTFRTFAANLGLLTIVASSVRADAEPKSAHGRATVTDVRTSFICSFLKSGKGQTAEFDAKLVWLENGAQVTSQNGEFSCKLTGNQALSGGDACRFTVGGGTARTKVECPAAKVKGKRDGNALRLTALSCSGVAFGCNVEADLDVSITPK